MCRSQSIEEDFHNMNRSMRHVGCALVLTFGLVSALAAQDPGRAGGPPQGQDRPGGAVTGQVLHAATQRPLAGAQVYVVGVQLGAITDAEGKYTITGIPVGVRTVRF